MDALVDRILRTATSGAGIDGIADVLCEGLLALGVPLSRVVLAMPTVDPTFRAISGIWLRGAAAYEEITPYGLEEDARFERSPIHHLLGHDRTEGRWDLGDAASIAPFPLLQDLARRGGTDYLLKLIRFPADPALLGLSVSVGTDIPGGFTPEHIVRIEGVLPAVGLACYRVAATRIATEALKIYVGPRTSAKILAGDIKRGTGQAISAAVFFADLKNFTSFTETHPPEKVIGWLNEHFEVLGDAIDAEDGEILKFMGDSILAIFPVGAGRDATKEACGRALSAAKAALAGTDALNRARKAIGAPPIAVDIVLHFGDVHYGNVGAARRLDFTVIGAAVNEASRIEKLCDGLGRNLLLSESFATQSSDETQLLGTYALRGVSRLHRIFGLAGQP